MRPLAPALLTMTAGFLVLAGLFSPARSSVISQPGRHDTAIEAAFLLPQTGPQGYPQEGYPPQNAPPAGEPQGTPASPQQFGQPGTPPLSPQQLDDMVAPIALYPDPLLGEILAASTYPAEIVEAEQWSAIIRTGNPRSSWARRKNSAGIPAYKGWSPSPMCLPIWARI